MLTARALDLIQDLDRTKSLEELWALINDYLLSLGITHAIYTFIDPLDDSRTIVLTQLPHAWQKHYLEQQHVRVDPFFTYCCTSFLPIRTGPDYLPDHPFLTAAEQRFISEAGETGFRSGFSAPVRLRGHNGQGFGGWNFGTSLLRNEFEKSVADQGAELWLVAFLAHEYIQRLSRCDAKRTGVAQLSSRERESLLWLARGLRTEAIAERMGIARITVDVHFRKARKKLCAATREEALAKAITGRLITP